MRNGYASFEPHRDAVMCFTADQLEAERQRCYELGRIRERAHMLDELARLRKGHERYETARRMNPRQWTDAWALNISTGKRFDDIIDDLRPFMGPRQAT